MQKERSDIPLMPAFVFCFFAQLAKLQIWVAVKVLSV